MCEFFEHPGPFRDGFGTSDCLVHWDEAEVKLADGSTIMADMTFRFAVDTVPADPGDWWTPPTPAHWDITEERLESVTYFDDEGNGRCFAGQPLAAPLIDQFWAEHTDERDVLENSDDG